MIILVIEDDANKSEQLVQLVTCLVPTARIIERRSYQSGLRGVRDEQPDLVLLDMSMPTFDVTDSDRGGRPRAYGGRDILEEITRLGYETQVAVVTGFDVFGEGDERRTLEELDRELETEFRPQYLGSVFYGRGEASWRTRLTEIVLQRVAEIKK